MAIYVSGFICQDVIEEKSGLYSALRFADRLTVTFPAGVDPKTLAPLSAHVLILYRSEDPQRFPSTIKILDPEGQGPPPRIDNIVIDGGIRGHMSHAHLVLQPGKAGLWWIEVSVNDEVRLRIPFEIIHTLQSGSHPDQPQIQT
jgi:hypothetical protein